jgi:hypothetical protein
VVAAGGAASLVAVLPHAPTVATATAATTPVTNFAALLTRIPFVGVAQGQLTQGQLTQGQLAQDFLSAFLVHVGCASPP